MTALEQKEEASMGENHHVPTVPLTITVDTFFVISAVQYAESENKIIIIDVAAFVTSDRFSSNSNDPAKCSAEISAMN